MRDDAGAALAKAIFDRLAGFGGLVEIVAAVSEPWSSIAFAGARHRFALHIMGDRAGEAADRLRDGLDTQGFHLAGHILADIAVTRDERVGQDESVRLAIEAVTVESR